MEERTDYQFKPGLGIKMKLMRRIIQFVLMFWGVTLCNSLYSQTNMVFYPFENQQNASGYNPSFLSQQNKFTLSFFPISGINVGYNNQEAVGNMLREMLKGNQTNQIFQDAFKSMVKHQLFYQRLENELFRFGYQSKIGAFDFRIKENMQLLADVQNDFSELLVNQNAESIIPDKRQEFPAMALHYREYSFGFAREIIPQKLSVGVRLKAYYGKSSMTSDAYGLATGDQSGVYLQTHGALNTSAPIEVVTATDGSLKTVTTASDFSIGNYLRNSGNFGFGLDLGFNYKVNEQLSVAASVLDLGKIDWKNNLNTMEFEGNYKIDNYITVSPEGVITKNPDFSFDDTNTTSLYKIQTKQQAYSTRMPLTTFIELKYQLKPDLQINLVNRYINVPSLSYNSILLTGLWQMNERLQLSSGYALLGDSYFNIPFALLYRMNKAQFYMGTDNLLAIILPGQADFSGATFGVTLFPFQGKVKYKKQVEYLPFYRERKRKSGNK